MNPEAPPSALRFPYPPRIRFMNTLTLPAAFLLLAAPSPAVDSEAPPITHCGEAYTTSTVNSGGEIPLHIFGQPDAVCADTLTEALALARAFATEFYGGVSSPSNHTCTDTNCDNPADTCDALSRNLIILYQPAVYWDQLLQQWCVQYLGGEMYGSETSCTDCGVYYY